MSNAPRRPLETALIKSIKLATERNIEYDQDVIDMIRSIEYFNAELKKLFPITFSDRK